MTATLERSWRTVVEHTGRSDLPREVAQAIRAITRNPGNAEAWLAAARCLRYTPRAAWAFKCYNRARKLNPGDPALAEEAGMFGVTRLATINERRAAVFHLAAARADPGRRERTDPILLWYARPFPALVAMMVSVASLAAMFAGGATVRRGSVVVGDPPQGLAPLTFAGIAVAILTMAVVVALFWALYRPVHVFSKDVLRQVFWPLRVIHALALADAAVGAIVVIFVVAQSGHADALDGWAGAALAISFLSTPLIALLGLSRRLTLRAVLELVAAGGS